MFSSNLFEKILVNSIGNFDTDDTTNDDLQMSIIGPLLWSSNDFIEEVSSEEDENSEDELIDSHSRSETLIATKNKNTIIPESQNDESQRRKRKVCTNRMTAAEVCSELSKANISPHLLIAPHVYGESFGAAAHETQPFQIIVHPQVYINIHIYI
jgi:hypothetical protein